MVRTAPSDPTTMLVALPSMSVLRTAAAQRDGRPFVLVYSAKTPDRIAFIGELTTLREQLQLSVVYVVSAPPPEWLGPRGRVTRALLDEVLPPDLRGWQFLVCGPPPFVDASMQALTALGVPAEHVHAERFVGV
jgi:ferredoxin-NADP reductase